MRNQPGWLYTTLIIIAALTLTSGAAASAMRVENFLLLDQAGKAHELYYYSDAAAVVIMTQDNNCAATGNGIAAYQGVAERYGAQNVRFFLLNSSARDDHASIVAAAQQQGITLPVLEDDTQLIGESLDITHAGEILVFDTRSWNVVYRGPEGEKPLQGADFWKPPR